MVTLFYIITYNATSAKKEGYFLKHSFYFFLEKLKNNHFNLSS